MRSANTAMTSSASTMTPPMAPSGLRRAKPSTSPASAGSRHGRGSVGETGSVCTVSAISVADPRVEECVGQVDQQVADDDDDDDHEVDALDDRVVALHDGVDE